MKLSDLPNIGEDTESQLLSVGIDTPQKLADIGAEEAWLRLKAIDPSACIHRLYGLEGAILGISKKLLPEDRKKSLKEFYTANSN